MKICILGATGYLGNHIVNSLINENDGKNDIFCIYRKDSKSEKKFMNKRQVTYVVSDYNILRELFKNNKFDCIINASCTYLNGGG